MNFNRNKKYKRFKNKNKKNIHKSRSHSSDIEVSSTSLGCSKIIKLTSSSSFNQNSKILASSRNHLYRGWNLYFTNLEYVENSSTVEKVKNVENFLKDNSNLFDVSDVERTLTFPVDVNNFYQDSNFKLKWNSFEFDLKNNPVHTISCIGLAIHQVISTKLNENSEWDSSNENDANVEIPMIYTRILNFGPVLQLRNLKSNYFGKLITVKGRVIRVGNIKLMCTWMTFQCDTCGTVQFFKLIDGVYSTPVYCADRECKSKTFSPLLSSPHTKTLNLQTIRIQEIITDEYKEGGRVPRTIDCELSADLVDSCSPGDVAILTGIMKMKNNEEGSRQKNSNIFYQYIDVVSIVNCKTFQKDGIPGIEFSEKSYQGIKEIFSEKNLFRLIVQSLCPAIFGHEIVKAGLVLAMFGGCFRYEECRANLHVLIVGDPGLGKSRMLQACASAAPRGVYVCGNTSTTSGLTVTMTRESGGDCSLEAGALILSDQGCCCIDEFDKMSSQHQALLEVMEQQTVSIAKSGVVCVLPCRVSILAAANPVSGHFNKGKTIFENLKLGEALLSRFDIIFVLMDEPSVQADSLLSDHVIAMHTASKNSFTASSKTINIPFQKCRQSLNERLKIQPGKELDLIPHQLLRKYIAYAKQYVKPKVSKEASKILVEFYMKLRQCHQDWDGALVTPRLLESLIRFTEARAKLELREEATSLDAEDVVEILKHSILDPFMGNLDFADSHKNLKIKSKNQVQTLLTFLRKASETQGKSVFTVQELKEAAKTVLNEVDDFFNLLNTLNIQGYLLKKGSQVYELNSIK